MIWPIAITFAAFALAIGLTPKAQSGGYFPDIGPAIIGVAYLMTATIVSLAAWLLWAVVR